MNIGTVQVAAIGPRTSPATGTALVATGPRAAAVTGRGTVPAIRPRIAAVIGTKT